jgi:hypothetical protein
MSAVFSSCGTYRYTLTREWLTGEGTVLWIMLNPSTADATQDDPTVTRCIRFTQQWGHRRLAVANLYAYRSTNPDLVPFLGDEGVGPDNNFWIVSLAREADLVIAAWGARARPERAAAVLDLLADITAVHALKITAATNPPQPRHPLYLKGDLTPTLYRPLRSLALPVDAADVR